MIRCGLAKDLNRAWEIGKLKPELQSLIAKYRENSDGENCFREPREYGDDVTGHETQ